jgi:hypothetical protein
MGDYAFYRRQYSDKTTDVNILVASTAFANAIAAKSAKHSIFIQKIMLSITTHFDTGIVTFTDDAGVAIAVYADEITPATTGQGIVPVVWDFGPKGYAMVAGGNLDIAITNAGIIGVIHIEAYEKLNATVSAYAGASLQ